MSDKTVFIPEPNIYQAAVMNPTKLFLLGIFLTIGSLSESTQLKGATVTVCSSGCTTPSLQAALDSLAACGDTIAIRSTQVQSGNFTLKDRNCTDVTPITVTTDKIDWLPSSYARITPSHSGNTAVISTPNSSPALTCVLTAGVPAKHWRFIGIDFTTSNLGSLTNNLILSKTYVATNASELPDDITFDRCMFRSPLPNGGSTGVNITNAIYGEMSHWTVKNSFVGDIAHPGQESHGFSILTTPGPITLTNNFITASSMPIFSGGAITDYGVTPSNITVQYNYMWRPWKWNNDPAQPYYADFIANGAYAPCLKNHGELKFADTVTWRYNGHENMWVQTQCFSQYNGFTNTIRTGWSASFQTPPMGNMTMSDTTHVAWSGTYNIADSINNGLGEITTINRGVCINLPGGYECRPLTSYDNSSKRAAVTTPFSSASPGNKEWVIIYDAQQYLRNVSVTNNVFKNVARGVNTLGLDPSNGSGTAGKLTGSNISNNLFWNYHPYMAGGYGRAASGWTFSAGEEGFVADAAAYVLDHNTFFNTTPMSKYFGFTAASNGTVKRQPLWQSLSLTNNLAGPSAVYPVVGDGTTGNLNLTMSTYTANSSLRNNGMPDIPTSACTGSNTCSGNIAIPWNDPFVNSAAGILKLRPGSPYSNAGTDGKDLGADFDQLPLITGLHITPGQQSALLEFDLNAPIADARDTQPCILEVSSSRNLTADLDTYSVTNDLNPRFFRQPDTSARTNSRLPPVIVVNGHVTWPIGANASVIGDDGQSHDLRLAAGTTYYGRLMCYGDTQWFTFGLAGPSLAITSSHTGDFWPGQTGAEYSLTVSNVGAALTSGLVSVTDVLPSGLSATAMSGAGWSCNFPAGLTCTRSDALAPGMSYPVIRLTVNVALGVTNVVNTAIVSGGGQSNSNTASDPTTIALGSAVFVRIDTTTQGSWKGVYGRLGQAIAGDVVTYPSFAQVNFSEVLTWVDESTLDVRALQKVLGADRVKGAWYRPNSFDIDVNLTDGASHQIALYWRDWWSGVPDGQFTILDLAGNVLDRRRVGTPDDQGVYIVWSVRGHVKIVVEAGICCDAFINGLFLD